MKMPIPFLLGLFGAAALSQSAAAAPATSWEGVWRNTRNTVHLRVARCEQAMCGTVIWAVPQARSDARRGSGRDLIGAQLFSGFRQTPDGTWKGKIYLPDLNSNASATVTLLDQGTILVSGCVFLGLACRTQHWWRMSAE